MGTATIGGSALLGSGAFSEVSSHRSVTIEVAEDPDAYLGLDGCPGSPNSSYTTIEGGHLAIDMSSDNPTEGGGEGVNVDAYSAFGRVFQVTNQGKQEVCVYVEDDGDWPETGDGERRVDFYLENDTDRSIVDIENAVFIDVGESFCVGIKTRTDGLEPGDTLLDDLDDQIEIVSDAVCLPEPRVPPEEIVDTSGISFVAFCGNINKGDIESLSFVVDDDGVAEGVTWELNGGSLEWVVLFGGGLPGDGGQNFLNFEIDSGQTEVAIGEQDRTVERNNGNTENGQHPSCPCIDGFGGDGVKYDVSDDGTFSSASSGCGGNGPPDHANND